MVSAAAGSPWNLCWLLVPPAVLLFALAAGDGAFLVFMVAAVTVMPLYLLDRTVRQYRLRDWRAASSATAALVLYVGYALATVVAVATGPPPEGVARSRSST